MADVTASFAAADVNGDGMLDFDEFTTWMAHFASRSAAAGTFMDTREETYRTNFDINNGVNPATAGFTLGEFFQTMGVWMPKSMELKAAAAQ